jgi:hypothetical protein
MQYRTFQKTGEQISLLGLGTFRLPLSDNGSVNEAEALKIIRAAIDGGVNYIDTAYMYHDGASEVIIGKALKDGYRDKVFIADKMFVTLIEDEEGQQHYFNEQLSRLDVSTIDMYLVHSVTETVWKRAVELNTMRFLEQKRAEGKIKHIGFSYHYTLPFFKEVIDAYPWDFCMIQLNFMDTAYQAGVEGLKYAASKGIPVIIMQPLKGGKLTDMLPENVEALWEKADIRKSPAEWALRWVADFPEVLTILSGVNSMAQLVENMKVLNLITPNSLTDKERGIIKQVTDAYNELIPYICIDCRCCMPCTQGIHIQQVITCYNEWFAYKQNPKIKDSYDTLNNKPSRCTACGVCEANCPQSIPITEVMKKTAEIFEKAIS